MTQHIPATQRYYGVLIESITYLAGKSLEELLLDMSRGAVEYGPNPYLLAGAVVHALENLSTPWSIPKAKGE